jgi:hypothetical protein
MSRKMSIRLRRVARIMGFTLAIVMLFASPCLGGHETLIAGDHIVSFDFNTTQDYVLTGGVADWNANAIDVPFQQSVICIAGNSSVYQTYLATRIARWSPRPVAMIIMMRINSSIYDNDTTYQLSKDFFGIGVIDQGDYDAQDLQDVWIDRHLGVLLYDSKLVRGYCGWLERSESLIAAYCYKEGDNLVVCSIASTFPWNDGTKSLIETLHVEPVENVSADEAVDQSSNTPG